MPSKSRQFPDDPIENAADINMSDADLEALMAGPAAPPETPTTDVSELESGERVQGIVVDLQAGDVLVELDSKTHALIDESEFEAFEDLPEVGTTITASFVRYDPERDLVILSVSGARKEVFWEELHPGVVLEGTVTATNRGGLTLDIKGTRAFLPISQIELTRVEDLEPYVGKKLRVEVTSFDRADQNIIVSRRVILERDAQELRGKALSRLGEGEVLKGTIVRINDFGAFIDLGGVEGLLHASKIRQELGGMAKLEVGSTLEVEVQRVDPERERVSLDFKRVATSDWSVSIEGYEVGDEVTGWVSRLSADGAWVSIEEGIEGIIPRTLLLDLADQPQKGAILRSRIRKIDRESRRIDLEPID
jgi:small subunit ribosomal protein S1